MSGSPQQAYFHDEAANMLRLAAERIPEDGWVSVPIEPTVEMLMAGRKRLMIDMSSSYMGPNTAETYKAIIAARPEDK